MDNIKKRLVLMIILSLLLTACGPNRETVFPQKNEEQTENLQEQNTQTELPGEEKKSWAIEEEQILPDADQAAGEITPKDGQIFQEEWFLVKEIVYRVVVFSNIDESAPEEEFFKGYGIQKLEPPYVEWNNTFIAPGDWLEGEFCEPWIYVAGSLMTEKGLAVRLKGKDSTYIGEWNEENGTTVKEIDSSFLMTDDSEKYSRWWKGQKGDLLLWNNEECVYIDSNFAGKEKLESEAGFMDMAVAENPQDGKIYLSLPVQREYHEEWSDWVNMGAEIVALDNMQVLLSSMDMGNGGHIFFTTDTEGYLYQSGRIAEFSLNGDKLDIIYDFYNEDRDRYDKMMNANKQLKYMAIFIGIQGGYAREDGSHILLVACGDESWQIWQMCEDEQKTGRDDGQKQVLEWAVTVVGQDAERAVVGFNQQSKDYKVVFRQPDEGEDFEDFRTRIQAELAAGGGPDILTEGAVMDMNAGARRGYLADLTEAFAEYGKDMLPSVWSRVGMVGERRYAVPYSFSINTLAVDGRHLGSRTSWTMEDAMAYMEDSGAEYFLAGEREAELFFCLGLMTETNSRLVDWQNNTCYLNSVEGIKLLEFAEKYADYEGTHLDSNLRASEGKVAAVRVTLGSPADMGMTAAIFEDEEAYIGYPVENGESGHWLNDNSLMVNQAGSNVEGAVEFIKFLLSEDTQSNMSDRHTQNNAWGFPVRSSAMEQIYNYLQQGEPVGVKTTVNGLEYEPMALTDESIQKLKELVESARPMGARANGMMSLVDEEMKDYRAEGKTMQQVLDIINNRAQLYLDETGE